MSCRLISLQCQCHCVAQAGCRGIGRSIEVITCQPWHHHIGRQADDRWVIAIAAKQLLNARQPPAGATHARRSLDQWHRSQIAEQCDGVEQVGLADTIGSRNASQRPEAQVNAAQVLETVDLQASQHATHRGTHVCAVSPRRESSRKQAQSRYGCCTPRIVAGPKAHPAGLSHRAEAAPVRKLARTSWPRPAPGST